MSDDSQLPADTPLRIHYPKRARSEQLKRILLQLVAVGVGLGIAGCGMKTVVPLVATDATGVALADSATGTEFTLGVSDGALTLAAVSGSAVPTSDPGLIDQATGLRYSLAIAKGALTVTPSSSSSQEVSEIELKDTQTKRTYALKVTNGTLTLIPA